MWYIIVILVAGIGLIFGIGSCIPQNSASIGHNGDTNTVDFPKDSITGPVSRAQMKKLLQKLADTPPPESLDPGAMCYEMVAPPKRAEYICPNCGEKTLYTDEMAQAVLLDIADCRNGAALVSGVTIKIDESQYCRHCNPDIASPVLCMEVIYKDDPKPVRTCDIRPYDLQLLNEFTHGQKKTQSFFGQESPLKENIDRLEELLGVEVKHKVEK